MMNLKVYCFISFFMLFLANINCQASSLLYEDELRRVRDSLEKVQYPTPVYPQIAKWSVIEVRTQKEWNSMLDSLKALLWRGERNVEIRVTGKGENNRIIALPIDPKPILGLKCYNANVRFINDGARIVAENKAYSRDDGTRLMKNQVTFWTLPYEEFNIDETITDSRGNEVPFMEQVSQVKGDIIKVSDDKDGIWKFQIDLPDLSEKECKDFYVLMTRDWTSARHKVSYVKEGWLYYELKSTDLTSNRNPNVDWIQYKTRPRYRLINSPISTGLHYVNGQLYVPWNTQKIFVNKGGSLILMGGCELNLLEISGFNFSNFPKCPIGIYNSIFHAGVFIRENKFSNLSSSAISVARCRNIVICDNVIRNTRTNAIDCGGINTTVIRNNLHNIGWMLQTCAITGGGDSLHICDNIIEDFNYAAIACGSRRPSRDSVKLTYIIERNIIRLTKDFTDSYIQNTLADGGGIYIGPQNTQGIIRHNVIENIKGINSNRGIFLDDGAKNLAIYGNLIMNTANCYDIDLRLCNTFADNIPDHNTGNSIFNNIMTGGYRFEDAGEGSNCIGGENVLLGTGMAQKTVVELKRRAADRKVQGSKERRVQGVLESMPLDGFVKKQMRNKN